MKVLPRGIGLVKNLFYFFQFVKVWPIKDRGFTKRQKFSKKQINVLLRGRGLVKKS
jgi:hypothetical protein